MAASNFERAFVLVLKHEGGYVDHPADPGGATKLGVTQATLTAYLNRVCTKDDVRGLTVESVKPIYRKNYWDAVKGDELPSGLDYAVFDFAVNSGPGRAARYLQKVVNVSQDGLIGPNTLAAVARKAPRATIKGLCAARLGFLRRLSTWPVFGKGWGRRVADVETEALAMAVRIPGMMEARAAPPKPPQSLTPAKPSEPMPGFWASLWAAAKGVRRSS